MERVTRVHYFFAGIVAVLMLSAAVYQAVRVDALLSGEGTDASPLSIDTSTYIATQYDISGLGGGGSTNDSDIELHMGLGGSVLAETLPAYMIGSTQALADTRVYFYAVYLSTDQTITGVLWYQTTTGAYTADNYNGVGLYSYSGGTLTLQASSTDDGDIWKASTGIRTKAFSSTYAATAGVYYIAIHYNSSAVTTPPAIGKYVTASQSSIPAMDYTNSAKRGGYINSLTALPASQAASGIASYQVNFYLAIY